MTRLSRDWSLAYLKTRGEGSCRVCGGYPVDSAHVIGRRADVRIGNKATVNPESVIPLCRRCHTDYDAHRLDVLPVLTLDEQVQAVRDAGGIVAAYRRVTGGEATIPISDAIQAVRDTEARVRHHYALSGRALREVGDAVRNSTLTDAQKVGVIAGVLANGPLDDAPGGPCEGAVFAARREAFREAVKACERAGRTIGTGAEAARMLSKAFLSPDNPEGNA